MSFADMPVLSLEEIEECKVLAELGGHRLILPTPGLRNYTGPRVVLQPDYLKQHSFIEIQEEKPYLYEIHDELVLQDCLHYCCESGRGTLLGWLFDTLLPFGHPWGQDFDKKLLHTATQHCQWHVSGYLSTELLSQPIHEEIKNKLQKEGIHEPDMQQALFIYKAWHDPDFSCPMRCILHDVKLPIAELQAHHQQRPYMPSRREQEQLQLYCDTTHSYELLQWARQQLWCCESVPDITSLQTKLEKMSRLNEFLTKKLVYFLSQLSHVYVIQAIVGATTRDVDVFVTEQEAQDALSSGQFHRPQRDSPQHESLVYWIVKKTTHNVDPSLYTGIL